MISEVVDHTALLHDQIAYYKARAGEYDQWFLRQGRYDRGPRDNSAWFKEVEQVRSALHSIEPSGSILEFAGGTGLWTERLVSHADSILVLDASEETIKINQARCASSKIKYEIANIFEWTPRRTYDFVFLLLAIACAKGTR